MRLFEAIFSANERWVRGDQTAAIPREEAVEALPLVALSCIDVRLNRLLPHALGVDDTDFIWLRNAGNIITGPLTSTIRSLALACAIKGGREIAVIGHTDCLVGKTTMLQLTNELSALGVQRNRLPENLTEFFGLFASERQNVIKAVDFVRQSPLIGANIPVHGLVMDIQSGRLEWVVNGYQTFATSGSELKLAATVAGRDALEATVSLPDFKLGEMKFPEFKIGQAAVNVAASPSSVTPAIPASAPPGLGAPHQAAGPTDWHEELRNVMSRPVRIRVLGHDLKQYGPATVTKLLEWLEEKRIGEQTPAQIEGTAAWQPLAALIKALKAGQVHPPPPIGGPKPALSSKLPKRH